MSTWQRFRIWVRNPRNFVLLGGASASVVAIVKACPLLFPNQLYRPLMEGYKGGKKIQLTKSQIQEYEDTCRLLEVDTNSYHLFVTSRWDPKVRGLPFLPSGVLFGIPAHFIDEPVLPSSKFAENIKVHLNSEEGSDLKQSLTLSQKARKFALAKEVVHAHKCFTAYPVVIAPGAVVAGFATTFAVQVTAGMFPLSMTAFLVGSLFLFTYRYLTGALNERNDLKTDEIVAQLGQDYVEGGIEFYQKNLERNKALRKLLGTKGEKLYSYYGNVIPGVAWSSGAPITLKRDNLASHLKSMQHLESEMTDMS